MTEIAVRAVNIARSYGDRIALDDFTLDVPRGGVFGLLGPNGSGKSTFIALLAAMQSPDSGTLEIFGEAPSRELLKRVATVFQENTSDPLMKVTDYLKFSGRLFGVPSGELHARSFQLLERFGLGTRAHDRIGSLSGGMRRRLEVVRAMLHQPDLLLLDEPTTGIDAEERSVLWRELLDGAEGTTILLATNDLAEADAVCHNVVFVQAGKVVASGTPATLKAGLRRESVRITLLDASPGQLAKIAAIPGTGAIAQDGDTVVVTTDDASTFVPRLFEAVAGGVRSVAIATASLQDAYFQHVRRRTEGSAK
ncbi:MAG: ABC transporter ATP-binding protein [bacterium]